MANTYSAIYLHLIFAVKHREAMIVPTIRQRLHAYISSAINGQGHQTIQVGGVDDHIHILFKFNLNQSIPELVKQVKIGSSNMVNDAKIFRQRFHWQTGYAIFSVSPNRVPNVKNYIINQNTHHKGMTLRDETKKFLESYGCEYDERYIFCEP